MKIGYCQYIIDKVRLNLLVLILMLNFSYLYFLITKQHDFNDYGLLNSNYREINATYYDENFNVSLIIGNYIFINCPTDNIYFSFFRKETYKSVRPLLMDPNLPQNEKILILRKKLICMLH